MVNRFSIAALSTLLLQHHSSAQAHPFAICSTPCSTMLTLTHAYRHAYELSASLAFLAFAPRGLAGARSFFSLWLSLTADARATASARRSLR
jgi:hypothetical protein